MTGNINSHNANAAAMWGSTGRAYDEISRATVASGAEHCIARLNPMVGDKVLDVATGTGWTARSVAARGATVTGVDISEGMLEAARQIASESGLNIDYRLGDAESLPFADGEFDCVISTCGAMFAPDRSAVASELARVCRQGGRLALMCWTPDSCPVELRQVLARHIPPPPVPAPSPFDWGDPDWVELQLGDDFDLGFERGTTYHHVADGSTGWEVMAQAFGPVRAVALQLDDNGREEAKADFAEFYDKYRTELGVSVPNDYLIIAGTRR